ncbi:hypothetical protein P9E03_16075 [Bacillus mojavensis]|uniref:hypothetical protein n=1 Tax=Bacillus mojavensis TaxID=72360 RepID=UPI002DBFE134|nr:hypothetical protein [Bacillus mojavensis]MEC1800562.1 hypothetical protein [Bacillus mojavensis]
MSILDPHVGAVITVYDLDGGYAWGELKEIDTTLNLIKVESKPENVTYTRYFSLASIKHIQLGEPYRP